MTVNKGRVRLLVDALRGGEFRQGQATLRTPEDDFCCLGVACEVASRNGLGITWTRQHEVATLNAGCSCKECAGRWMFDGNADNMPPSVWKWFGFDLNHEVPVGSPADPTIAIDADGDPVSMVRANDDLHWDFDAIATALEQRYLTEGTEK